MTVTDRNVTLQGIEIRCPNKVTKVYNGKKVVRTCNSLLAVVESSHGSMKLVLKCNKSNCRKMVTHSIQS